MEKKSLFLSLVLCCMMLCGVLLIPACSLAIASDPPAVLAVTPKDTSAKTLDVMVTIFEDQDATDHTTDITFTFETTVIEEKNHVLFDDPNEEVVCNNVHQPLGKLPSYKLSIPSGGHYICAYSGNSEDEKGNGMPLPFVQMFDIAPRSELAPQPPTITSNGFSVRYTRDPDDRCTIVGIATDSAGHTVTGSNEFSYQGIYSGPGTSSLHGTGDIFLKRTCHWKHYQPSESHPSEFDDMDVTYISQASVEVTWSH